MTFAALSDLCLVVAAIGYVLACGLFSLEWAAARGLAATRPKDGSEDAQRIRVDSFGRYAVALTVVSFASHTLSVVLRGVAADRFPWGNMYEFIATALLFVALAYLVGTWKLGLRSLGIGVTLLCTVGLGLAITVFYVDVAPLVPALHSAWFIVHILSATVSGAAFNIGAIASIMYLIRSRRSDPQDATGYWARIPSLKRLDLIAYRAHAFAFPLWTFTIVAGAIWAQYAWGRFWNWDPKETWSLVTFIVYAAYLHARSTAGWRGVPAAWIAVIGVVTFWFNFIGVNLLFTGLHSYAGI